MEALNFSSMEQAAQACGINRGTLYRYFAFEQRPSIDISLRSARRLAISALWCNWRIEVHKTQGALPVAVTRGWESALLFVGVVHGG